MIKREFPKKYFNYFFKETSEYRIMIRTGTEVKWKWAEGTAKGKVIETFTEKVVKTIKGQKIVRHGEEDNKALHIEQEDGTKVLKLESEIERED